MAAEIKKPPTLLYGTIAIAAILMVVLGAIALAQYASFAMQDELDRKVLTRPNPELLRLRDREELRLTTYQWIDQKTGLVRIPVARALELVLRERRQP
jgi:hypothetical protein